MSVSQLSSRAQRARRACVSGQWLTQLITVVSGKSDGDVFRLAGDVDETPHCLLRSCLAHEPGGERHRHRG